jgi:pilus assembly protein Flp/PilA
MSWPPFKATLVHWLSAVRDRERGATATEYAILVGFIAIVIVAGVTVFGSQLNDWFSSIASQLP